MSRAWVKANTVPVVLLALSLGSGTAAFGLFNSASKAPSPSFDGWIQLYVSRPKLTAVMEATFASDASTGAEPDDWTPDPMRSARYINLRVEVGVDRAPGEPFSLVLVIGGDARLTDIEPVFTQPVAVRTVESFGIHLEVADGTDSVGGFEEVLQLVQYEWGPAEAPGASEMITLRGRMQADPVSVGGGTTAIRLPSLIPSYQGRNGRPVGGGAGTVTFGPEAGLDGSWYTPAKATAKADLGIDVGYPLFVDSAFPPVDPLAGAFGERAVAWSGRNLHAPEAVLSDRGRQEQASRVTFVSGVLSGIAGGLLLEGLIRFRRGSRSESSGEGG